MSPDLLVRLLLAAVIGYLIGSIPTGYLVARAHGVNIFEVGSGNMGATNVARVGGIGWGIAVWLFDSLKGVIAVLIATQWLLPEHLGIATVLAGVCAIIGHNWSVFIGLMTGRIRGGKGAATAFGTLVLIVPVYVVATMLLLGGFVIARTRYVSLAVLMMFTVAAVSTVVLAGLQQMPVLYTLGAITIVIIVFYRFRENIRRLQLGTERRLGEPG